MNTINFITYIELSLLLSILRSLVVHVYIYIKLINRSTSKGNIDPSIYVMKINLYMFYLIQINYTQTYYIRNLIVIHLLTRVIPFHKPISACIRF